MSFNAVFKRLFFKIYIFECGSKPHHLSKIATISKRAVIDRVRQTDVNENKQENKES